MTPTDLATAGASLYGDHWKEPLAAALGVTRRSIDRWLDGSRGIPVLLAQEIADLQRATTHATTAARRVLGDEFRARVVRD